MRVPWAKKWRVGVVWLCVAMLATSCLRLERVITVEADGDMRHESVFDIDVAAALPILRSEYGPGLPEDAEGFLCDNVANAGVSAFSTSDATVDRFNNDGFCGVRVTEDFDGLTDMSIPLSYVLATGSGGSTLVKVGDGWEFNSTVGTGMLEAYPIGNDARVKPQLREQAEVTFRLELPGEAIPDRHNADEVDGGTFIWRIDPNDSLPLLFAATTGAPEPSGTPLGVLIGGGAAVVLGLGVLGWLAVRSRRPSADAPTEPVVATTAAAPPDQPVFDESLGVWTAVDPVRGPVWYHEAANEWVPR